MLKLARSFYGFSLIELVAVLLILGIISATVASSLVPNRSLQMQSIRDQIVSTLVSAQQRAMSRRNRIRVSTSGNTIDVREDADGDGNFATSISVSMGGVQYPLSFQPNQSISAAVFDYDRLGRTTGTTLVVTQGGISISIVVTDSGYAY